MKAKVLHYRKLNQKNAGCAPTCTQSSTFYRLPACATVRQPSLFPELNLKNAKKLKSRSVKRNDEAEKLADLHIRLCPATQEKHRKGIITKIKQLLTKYTPAQVRVVIKEVSHRGNRGDGIGVVYKCMPYAETKLREKAFDANLVEDRREHPKQPARGESQPVRIMDENNTRAEANRQVRELLKASR